MQKVKDAVLLVIIIVWSIVMFAPRKQPTNYTPLVFRNLHTSLEHPDTFIGYWDRGMLYLQVTTYHDEDSTVNEDDQ